MNDANRTLDEINELAVQILSDRLGTVDALRFLQQFAAQGGDYTADRDATAAGLSVDEIFDRIQAQRAANDWPSWASLQQLAGNH